MEEENRLCTIYLLLVLIPSWPNTNGITNSKGKVAPQCERSASKALVLKQYIT